MAIPLSERPYPRGYVKVEPGHVTIFDTYGREVVHWVTEEFTKNDGLAAIAACNAIQMFYTRGVDAVAETVSKEIDDPICQVVIRLDGTRVPIS